MKIESSGKLYVDESVIEGAGRGVFAAVDMVVGDIIEVCPVISIPKPNPRGSRISRILDDYCFEEFGEETVALALGFGSLYNHSFDANAGVNVIQHDRILVVSALKNIRPHHEITINYHSGFRDTPTMPLRPNISGIPPQNR